MRNKHRQKDIDQFMKLYEEYHNDIFRFCMLKTNDRPQSLDITQETFMKYWEYLIQGKDIEKKKSLLYRIAGNLVIDHYRKKKDVLVEDFTDGKYEHFVKYESIQRQEDIFDGEKIISLLHKLPPVTRDILTLKFTQDLSLDEIASKIGKDKKTVSVYLHRGIKKLRTIVENYEKRIEKNN